MLNFFYKILCILILAFQIIEGAESHKQMVLTFDDLPLSPGPLYSIEKRSEIYVEKLAKVPVKAAFFCVGNNLKKWKEDGLAGVKKIVEAGHPICNHTFSHHHLSEKTVQDFLQDVGLNETIFSAMLTYEKWFRYPYMDIGLDQKTNGSIEKARSCAEALNQAGYSYGYATIDTFDWYLNSLLKEAMLEGKFVEESRLKKFYVEHIKDLLTHFSNQETEIDVLLMHLNDINALCLDEIISAIQ